MSMWAVLAAPLMVSVDLTGIHSSSLATVSNSEAVAIDQDPLGVQGTLLSSSAAGQVWVRPLSGGARAVALLNRGSTPVRIATSARAIGMPAVASYDVRNVWTHRTSRSRGTIAASVGGSSTTLLRVSLPAAR
jgi:alpha-galactosidase